MPIACVILDDTVRVRVQQSYERKANKTHFFYNNESSTSSKYFDSYGSQAEDLDSILDRKQQLKKLPRAKCTNYTTLRVHF